MTSFQSDDNILSHDPHYRLGVGLMIINKDNHVFMGRRTDMAVMDNGLSWQMPQGGIDAHEEPLTAAYREMREEIGTDCVSLIAESAHWVTYDLPPDLAGKLWGGRFMGQKQKWYLF